MKRVIGALSFAAILSSCAYYNGLYNAKRYAGQAERDARDGRMAAAADGWRLAAQHAESVYTRHRNSRWADDARLIRGRSLVYLEAWNEASMALTETVRATGDEEQRREAWLFLGRAHLGARRFDDAIAALDSALPTRDDRRRSEAYLYRGRAWLGLGRPDRALADFRVSAARDARFERSRAALAGGEASLAAAFADSVTNLPYVEETWLPLLDSLGRSGYADQSSALVDRLVSRPMLSDGQRARLLLGDGARRLAARQESLAVARFRAVTRIAPDSAEARFAAVRLARIELRHVTDSADVERLRNLFEAIAAIGGLPAQEATDLSRLLQRADQLARAPDAPDAWWLMRAELLRDSVGAHALAAAAFAAMPERFPDSPWTPKGVLNALAAGHPAHDSLLALLRERYPDNPYARIAIGMEDDPLRFAALEDSLRITLGVEAPGERPVTEAPGEDDVRNRRNVPVQQQRPVPRPAGRPAVDP